MMDGGSAAEHCPNVSGNTLVMEKQIIAIA
jgi:hypothetical protein